MCKYKAKEDGRCTYRSCAEVTVYCHEGPCPYEVQTNGDRIRAMSDRDLASWLASRIANMKIREAEANGVMMTATWKAALYQRICMNLYDWFRRPAEEGNHDFGVAVAGDTVSEAGITKPYMLEEQLLAALKVAIAKAGEEERP